MEKMSKEELLALLAERAQNDRIMLREREFRDMDLTGADLSHADLTLSSFQNVALRDADLHGSTVKNALFDGCLLRGADFRDADMATASFRYCDMGGCDIRGADLFGAVLEHAMLEGVVSDERTRWFRLHCPEKGAFLAYKKCVNDRMVQLLVPEDARRTSATLPSCRCDKAKVLTIKSFDFKEEFEEAWSLVDEDFVYRKGQWVQVDDFNEDRWQDSTTGIHFWLTREEAEAY